MTPATVLNLQYLYRVDALGREIGEGLRMHLTYYPHGRASTRYSRVLGVSCYIAEIELQLCERKGTSPFSLRIVSAMYAELERGKRAQL
jgi:hypothetical protein